MDRTRVRWGRLAAAGMVLTLSVSLLGGRAGAGPAHQDPERSYIVQPGDTVWGIARRSVGPAGDPRAVVDVLIRRNRLQGGVLIPGERLMIPSEGR